MHELWLVHTCHVEMVVGGDIFNLSEAMENIGPKSLLLFLEIEDCVGKPSCGGSQLHFAIYNAFYAPLLCKGGMMKRISSLRNEIPAAPPTPSGYTCCWRCSTAHWRKIPSTPILVSWRTWPFYIPCALFYAVKGWEGRWWGGGGVRAVKAVFRPIQLPSKQQKPHICKWECELLTLHTQ